MTTVTNTETTALPEGFKCKCGRFNRFSSWVYAHWLTPLGFICLCGRQYNVRKGKVRGYEKLPEVE